MSAAPDPRRPHISRLLSLALFGILCVGAAGAGRAQRSVEFVATFSTNSRVRQQLERMGRLAAQSNWDQWLGGYQQLVDDPRDLVLARDEEFLIGVRHHCHQLLAGLPAPARQRYRDLFDGEARRRFDLASRDSDPAAMRDVYSRYRFSSYGNRALQWLADHALDEGRSEYARIAYGRLAKDPAVSAATLLRYALAAGAAGRPAEAREALDRVRKKHGALPATVAGQLTTGADAAGLVEKDLKPAPAPTTGPYWTSFAGDLGDRKMPPAPPRADVRGWEFAQTTVAVTTSAYRSSQMVIIGGNSYGTSRARFSFLTFPAVRDDTVWVQGAQNLTALSLATGERRWNREEFLALRDEIPRENPNPRAGGYYVPPSRPVQTAPALEGNLLVTRLPLTMGANSGGRWPVDHAIGAFDARTGRSLWRKVVGGDPSGIYFNIPTIQGKVVYTGSATYKGGITEYNGVALDAGSGETLWSTYLGAGSDALHLADGSPAAIRDGMVWIESSLYTLNALDLVSGEIRLIYRYNPGRRSLYRGGMDSSPSISGEPISLIATAPGPVVFAPRWGSDAVAIDPATGRLLWVSPKAPGGSAVGVLFGSDRTHAYICGGHVRAINLADGRHEWTWEPEADDSPADVGYAALCGDRIYVPVGSRIHVLNAADRKKIETLDLTQVLGSAPGLATITVAGERLLVATRERLFAFTPRKD